MQNKKAIISVVTLCNLSKYKGSNCSDISSKIYIMGVKGNLRIAVLCVKFSDNNSELEDDAWYRDLFISRGTEGLNDYYATASLGAINFDSSKLFP